MVTKMVMEMGVEANLMAEVVAEGPCTRLEGACIRNSSTFNLLTSWCQVKYVTCTLLNGALTWWNSHVRTVRHDAAYDMSWKDFMKMVTEAYCPRNEIQKLESELWNLTVKGTDVVGYTQSFQELALLYPRMVPEEEDKVERYIWVLPDSIQGNVTSARTTRLQDTIKLANSLMDQKIHVFAAREADYKRRM
ncbi:reverse transcriptase domain-containing protein [Tanacetum coccineum]